MPRKRAEDPQTTFERGKQAAGRLVRLLAVPDPTAQLVVARVLIEVEGTLAKLIEAGKTAEGRADPWPGERARAAMLAGKPRG